LPKAEWGKFIFFIIIGHNGPHSDSAFASFDDNELSDWVNDGQLSTAWIEYELEREAVVTEVNLKLNNFRTRTYPLRITVDGIEVFNDTNAASDILQLFANLKEEKKFAYN